MLSIIITHYKTLNLLIKCLDSIKKCEGKRDFEVIVCDSQAQKKTKQIIKNNYPQVRYIKFTENVGYGRLVNAGIKAAQGNYYLILNADVIVNVNGIEKMLNYFNNNPDIGVLGPKLLNIDGTLQNSCFRWYDFWVVLARRTSFGKTNFGKKVLAKFLMEDYDKKHPREVNWVMGSAFLTSKKVIQKVGLIDSRFFMYFDDVDFCKRVWLAGFKVVYFPEAIFIHHHLKSSDSKRGVIDIFKNPLTRIHIVSYIKYTLKWMFKKNLIQFLQSQSFFY